MKNKIEVFGKASLSIPPDVAVVTLGVATENRSLTQAQSENVMTITNVIQAIRSLNVHEQDIQTSRYAIFPQYDYADGITKFRDYRVEHLLTITIYELDNVGALVDLSVQNGANLVQNISFIRQNNDAVYRHLLKEAIQDAFQKGKTIAWSLGIFTPIYPILIAEKFKHGEAPIASLQMTPIVPGEIVIEAKVAVHFAF